MVSTWVTFILFVSTFLAKYILKNRAMYWLISNIPLPENIMDDYLYWYDPTVIRPK